MGSAGLNRRCRRSSDGPSYKIDRSNTHVAELCVISVLFAPMNRALAPRENGRLALRFTPPRTPDTLGRAAAVSH
jgi:hypothetical protein